MSFLTKGMLIQRRALISILLFSIIWMSWSATFRGIVMHPYLGSLDLPISLGLLVGISSTSGFFFGGLYIDKVRRRKPFFLLFFALSALFALPVIYISPTIVSIYLIGISVVTGITCVAALSFLADNTDVHERGRVAGLTYSTFGILNIIMTEASQFSVDLYFALFSALTFAAGLVSLFVTREKISLNEEWRRIPTRTIFENRNFLLFSGAIAALGFFWGSNGFLIFNYASGILENPRVDFIQSTRLTYIFLAFFIGFMADRFGRRLVVIMGALSFAAGFMIFVLFGGFWALIITTFFFGIGYASGYIPLFLIVFGDMARKESRGRSYGIGASFLLLGGIVGAAVGEALVDASTGIVMTLTVFAAFLLILPTSLARETLPPKRIEEEMQDYIKEIEDETIKDKDESLD